MIRRTFLCLAALMAGAAAYGADAGPKKLLVVTVTTGFRHSSIETAEKVLAEIGKSSGAFTVDYVQQPPGQPKNPGRAPEKKPKETDEAFKTRQADYSKALADYNTANEVWREQVKAYMADKMALDKIKDYDGFIFANTTGDLQFPDREGFVELIKGGKAFIAMHSGGDTYHPFRGYVDMLGGEFQTHKSQVEIQPILHNPAHPATKPIPNGWRVYDEIYIFKNYDPAKVHALMGLNAHPNENTPGYYPVSWCKDFGKGKVFYTSLGHREDVWDPTWKADTKDRKNSPEIAKTYQEHILGGILWSLGLVEGESELGNVKATAEATPEAGN
ncbi:ThuA domain-containing protein [Prosthecobacter fusiformis]|nr:ThuA domain-containing protein [Prosthecobacter fusiformis]